MLCDHGSIHGHRIKTKPNAPRSLATEILTHRKFVKLQNIGWSLDLVKKTCAQGLLLWRSNESAPAHGDFRKSNTGHLHCQLFSNQICMSVIQIEFGKRSLQKASQMPRWNAAEETFLGALPSLRQSKIVSAKEAVSKNQRLPVQHFERVKVCIKNRKQHLGSVKLRSDRRKHLHQWKDQ